jgi:hypothetical protein
MEKVKGRKEWREGGRETTKVKNQNPEHWKIECNKVNLYSGALYDHCWIT